MHHAPSIPIASTGIDFLPPSRLSAMQRHGADASEIQADRFAHAAVKGNSSEPVTPGSLAKDAPSGLQDIPASVNRALARSGSPLPEAEKTWLSERLGHRFDSVRIHADGEAARSASDLGAKAYTVGNRIAFAPGEYQPGSDTGRHLLAHELTHVLQQKAAGPRLQMQPAPTTGTGTTGSTGTTTTGTATTADRRSFVRDTISFLNSSADFYGRVAKVDAATFDRVINSWYAMVVNQERIIDADLGGDASLKADLRAAYTAALRVLVTLRSTSGGGSEDEIYRVNSGRIPLWAQPHPSHLEAGVTTPIPDDVTVTQNRGNFLFHLNGFDVTVRPDARVRTQSSPGLTSSNIHWGGVSSSWSGPRGRRTITAFTGPPTPTLSLATTYIRGTDTTATSGYGRGTTAEDQAGARVTTESDSLAFHESRHSQAVLDFVRANRPPSFTGHVGDTTTVFNTAINQWHTAATSYSTRLGAADTSQVHCVGFTIDQFNLANARRGRRIVRECP
jgi:Domain of unknown function (DUF4157)